MIPPPQDPIKAGALTHCFDIHNLGNLCHQHIFVPRENDHSLLKEK